MFRFTRYFLPGFLFDGDGGGGGTATPPAPTPDPTPRPTTEPAPRPTPTHEETVSYERFREVNEGRKTAEAEVERLKNELSAQKRAGLPEIDAVKSELADVKAQLDAERAGRAAADAKSRELERGGWITRAASAAGFINTDDALLRVDLTKIETEADAQREVQTLAAADHLKYLIRPDEPAASGGDLLQRVLEGGRPVARPGEDGSTAVKEVIPAAQFNALTVDQLATLQNGDPELYERSLRAAAAAA